MKRDLSRAGPEKRPSDPNGVRLPGRAARVGERVLRGLIASAARRYGGGTDIRRLLPGIVALAAVLWLVGSGGGYFAVDWGVPALALLAIVLVVVVADARLSLSRAEIVGLTGLFALLAWSVASALWSTGVDEPLVEAERTGLYLAAVAACLLAGGRPSAPSLAAGLLIAVTVVGVWSLGPLLAHGDGLSADVGAGRLAGPLGYWNGLGLVATIGCLLALGFASHGRRLIGRAAASATLAVLVPTLYFTFSRGSWIALGAGLIVAVAVEPKRTKIVRALLQLVPVAALALVLAMHAPALGRAGGSSDRAAHAGHVLGFELLAVAALAAALAAGISRLPPPRPASARLRSWSRLLAALLAVLALVAFTAFGKPVRRIDHALASFRAEPAAGSTDLRSRLLSASGNGRSAYWGVAWREVRTRPLLGGGAGSYAQQWLRWRPVSAPAADAHNLYLETLAELGPVGLAALLMTLLAPFALLRRARRDPLVAACAGAYVAFLVHAALDWDWELTAVGLVGLLCGVPLLLAGRATLRPKRGLGRGAAFAVAGLAVVLGAAVFVMQVGNSALAGSESAASRDDNSAAANDARKALSWAPWSARAHRDLGEALLAEGDVGGAAAAFRGGIAQDAGDWQLWYDLALATRGKARATALTHAALLNPLSPDLAQVAAASGR